MWSLLILVAAVALPFPSVPRDRALCSVSELRANPRYRYRPVRLSGQRGDCAALLLLTVVLASCGGEHTQQEASRVDRTDSGPHTQPSMSSAPGVAPPEAERPLELVEAATRLVGFLRGEVPFDSIHLADTVSLYLGREEGRTRRDVERARLRDRANWRIYSESLRHSYSFVPPAGTAALTTRVGRHLNCLDYSLSATFTDLARFPHVGTTLRYGTASCLQTWNLTVVFDPQARPPTVVAAVYDQFEW